MWLLSVFICLLYVNSFVCFSYQNNVCRTLADYKTIAFNKNCSYNPDVGSSPRRIAKRLGYPFERHAVTTEDGYILTLHRIPSSPHRNTTKKRQPILIQHGLATSSVFWMIQGKKSIAFFLADNGHDVWLSNSRGTYYSPLHVSKTMRDPDYWNFGLHEMAIYDLPACIDFIANKTGEKGNLIYIGHSMGTTISYIYSIVKKQHAEENLRSIISLAPVAYMNNVMGAFKILAPTAPLIMDVLQSSGIYAVGENHEIQKELLTATCGRYPLIIPCNLIIIFAAGLAVEQFQAELLPVFFSYYPSGISLRTLKHFSQNILNNNRFEEYDYGPTKNMKIYNSTIPPEYDVSKISIPVFLFVGSEDIVGDIKDVNTLEKKINSGKRRKRAKKIVFPFAHNDFFIGKDIEPFHKTILQVIQTKPK